MCGGEGVFYGVYFFLVVCGCWSVFCEEEFGGVFW